MNKEKKELHNKKLKFILKNKPKKEIINANINLLKELYEIRNKP